MGAVHQARRGPGDGRWMDERTGVVGAADPPQPPKLGAAWSPVKAPHHAARVGQMATT
jgi:hypothetical protein